MNAPLLHLTDPSAWRSALATGSVEPPSLAEVGFVHLSTPDQVHLPANRLFAGRRDLVTLVVDPDRAGAEIRWEPGVPGDPESMRFPHLYGPLPTSAVLAVAPYRPDADGVFAPAVIGPVDDAWRAETFELALLRRSASRELPVTGGVAVLTSAVPGSHFHNQPFYVEPVTADVVEAETDAVLGAAGLTHRSAVLHGSGNAIAVAELADRGWRIATLVHQVAKAVGTPDGRAEHVGLDEVRDFRLRMWRAELPGISEEHLHHLVDRDALTAQVVDVRQLVRREGGRVVAAARLLVDGATAWFDALETDPEHRGRGHGDALLAESLATAAATGCDIVALTADGDSWPARWYERRGFAQVARSWVADRTG